MRCQVGLREGTLVEYTPVRVYGRALVKQIGRSLLRVQDNHMCSKKLQVEDIRP
jgi:hypothetical protein